MAVINYELIPTVQIAIGRNELWYLPYELYKLYELGTS
jgi:hypothetical protein